MFNVKYWTWKPSPGFWYQSAVCAQFYYFDDFSVLKKIMMLTVVLALQLC